MLFVWHKETGKDSIIEDCSELTTQETPSMATSMVSVDPLAVGQRAHELEDHEAPDAL